MVKDRRGELGLDTCAYNGNKYVGNLRAAAVVSEYLKMHFD